MICTCIFCGKEFEKNAKGRTPLACYDPECRLKLAEKQAEDDRMRKRKYRARVRKARKMSLSEIADLANKAGMTYGQFVAAMEGGTHEEADGSCGRTAKGC